MHERSPQRLITLCIMDIDGVHNARRQRNSAPPARCWRCSEPQSLRAAIAAKNVGSSSQSLMVLITHTMRSKPTARSRVWPRRRSERRPSGRSSVRRRHRHPDRVTDHRLSLAALECEGGQVLITRLQRLLLVTGGVLEVHQDRQARTRPPLRYRRRRAPCSGSSCPRAPQIATRFGHGSRISTGLWCRCTVSPAKPSSVS